MVNGPIVTVVGCFALAMTARGELQLAPRVADYQLDGVKLRRLVFSDGGPKEITYVPPAGWDYSGSTARLVMHPPNKPQAEGSVSRLTLSKPTAFEDDSLNKLAAEAIASLPAGSTDITVISQEKNPVFIGGRETILVTLSYKFYGEAFGRSLLVLNRDTEQLRFQFVSRLEDFKELQQAFLNSHFGWHNL